MRRLFVLLLTATSILSAPTFAAAHGEQNGGASHAIDVRHSTNDTNDANDTYVAGDVRLGRPGKMADAVGTSGTETEETFVTLAEGKSLSECISAAPKPGCRTSDKADGKQLALLGFLVAGLAFLGFKISRGVRQRDRAQSLPRPPTK